MTCATNYDSCKRQIRPLLRERAPHQQNHKWITVIKLLSWVPGGGGCLTPSLTIRLAVGRNVTFTLARNSIDSRLTLESLEAAVSRIEVEFGGRQSETARRWDSRPWRRRGRWRSPYCCKPLRSNAELVVRLWSVVLAVRAQGITLVRRVTRWRLAERWDSRQRARVVALDQENCGIYGDGNRYQATGENTACREDLVRAVTIFRCVDPWNCYN
jgi:hypothetical protein